MRRRIAIILLLLLGGAIVNVVVAWGLAAFTGTSSFAWLEIEDDVAAPIVARAWPHPIAPNAMSESTGPGVDVYALSGGSGFISYAYERRAGWPIRSFVDFSYSGTSADAISGRKSSLTLAQLPLHRQSLPIEPLPIGFIINTLFYALLLWLLLFAPFAARRMLRRRRGQCEKCAYPIGVSPVCTECGAAVPRKIEA